MHRYEKHLETLMNEILRVTDIMYQAIKADSFEIFESVLDERGQLLEEYDRACKGHEKIEAQHTFVEKMNQFELLIRKELKRFDQKMHEEHADTRKQLNALQSGQRKTQKYTHDYGYTTNGSNFDKKK